MPAAQVGGFTNFATVLAYLFRLITYSVVATSVTVTQQPVESPEEQHVSSVDCCVTRVSSQDVWGSCNHQEPVQDSGWHCPDMSGCHLTGVGGDFRGTKRKLE